MSDKISTHISDEGLPMMVDISKKESSERMAKAEASVLVSDELFLKLSKKSHNHKGEIFHTAILAGIMAAKETSKIIPLCHQIALSSVVIDYSLHERVITFTSVAKTKDATGVEMEALVAANIAALTFYDMCKGTDKEMTIQTVRLLEKSGGKSGVFTHSCFNDKNKR